MSRSDFSFHIGPPGQTRNDHPQYQLSANNPTTVTTSVTAGTGLVVSGGDGAGHGDITVAQITDAGWTNITSFTNGWGAAGSAPGYIKIGRIVYLRGALTAGTANTAAFTLPVGYRPVGVGYNGLVNNGAASANLLSINTSGVATPLNSATVWLSIVSFPAV